MKALRSSIFTGLKIMDIALCKHYVKTPEFLGFYHEFLVLSYVR